MINIIEELNLVLRDEVKFFLKKKENNSNISSGLINFYLKKDTLELPYSIICDIVQKYKYKVHLITPNNLIIFKNNLLKRSDK